MAAALIVDKNQSILFRCDASAEIGFGHLVRCLALADEIHRRFVGRIGFAIGQGSSGSELIKQRGYEVFCIPPEPAAYTGRLGEIVRQCDTNALIVDVRDDLSVEQLKSLRGQSRLIVLLDDLSPRRFAADLAFYPPVPQVKRASWNDFRGERFVGWEWMILRSEFAAPLPERRAGNPEIDADSVLITMGGSDPAGLTLQAVRAIELINTNIVPTIALGPGFRHQEALRKSLAESHRKFIIRESVRDMRSLMLEADLALCSYGMTAFELAATGVPAIYLCLTDDHAESASALAEAGAGCSLGLYSELGDQPFANAVAELLADKERRTKMATAARQLIDGQGARRLAEVLAARASQQTVGL